MLDKPHCRTNNVRFGNRVGVVFGGVGDGTVVVYCRNIHPKRRFFRGDDLNDVARFCENDAQFVVVVYRKLGGFKRDDNSVAQNGEIRAITKVGGIDNNRDLCFARRFGLNRRNGRRSP